MRGAEQSAKALPPHHVTCLATNCPLPHDQLVVETLMIPLGMRVNQVLVDRVRQRLFAQPHHMIQGFLFDGAHEPFAVGIQIGTPRGQDNRLHAIVLQQPIKGRRALRVSAMDHVSLAHKEPLTGIRELPSTLLHEGRSGMRGDACDLDAPCRDLHHHQDIVTNGVSLLQTTQLA